MNHFKQNEHYSYKLLLLLFYDKLNAIFFGSLRCPVAAGRYVIIDEFLRGYKKVVSLGCQLNWSSFVIECLFVSGVYSLVRFIYTYFNVLFLILIVYIFIISFFLV